MDKDSLIDGTFVNTFIKRRTKELHKGQCGNVLIIAGSEGMAGAAMLSAKGALRSGAGLVKISLPAELYPLMQIGVPEAICVSRSLPPEELEKFHAIVVGPGLGDDLCNVPIIERVLSVKTPCIVLDADGINLLSRNDKLKEVYKKAGERVILTPHPGEAGRLLACKSEEINQNRMKAALEISQRYSSITVLKGAGTLVATPNNGAYINTTGNPGMATGGSGDVLSGIIAALLGQGCACFEAAACGVYIHGLAGDIAAETLGEYGVIASDIAAMTGLAIKRTIGF